MKRIKEHLWTALFSLDIAVVFTLSFFAAHYWWTFQPWWAYLVFVAYPLLMRLNISVMSYRNKWSIASALIVFILGLVSFNACWLEYASEKIARIGLLISTAGLDGVLDRTYIDEVGSEYGQHIFVVTYLWVWVLPLLFAIIRFLFMTARRLVTKTEAENYSWKHIWGSEKGFWKNFIPNLKLSFLWQDSLGKFISLFLVTAAVAASIGDEMAFLPSVLATVALPTLTIACIHRLHNKTLGYKEIGLILLGGLLFWNAQYYTVTIRIMLLLASAFSIGFGIVMMERAIKNRMLSYVSFVFIAFILPSLSLGYNQYTVMDAARAARFRTYVATNGVLYVYSDKGDGLRDRYGIIVPCGYSNIEPCRYNYRLASLDNGQETKLYNLWLNKNVQRRITINQDWQEKAEELIRGAIQEQSFNFGQVIVMEAETGQLKIMASLGDSRSQKGNSYKNPWEYTFYTGLIRPFVHLAALQNGGVQLEDSVDTKSGIIEEGNLSFKDDSWRRGGYGKISYKDGFRLRSNISTYLLAKNAFGENSDSLFIYLKEYGADRAISLSDEQLTSLINIKPVVKDTYREHIFTLANGHGLKLTALQLAGMYSMFGDAKHSRMELYHTEGDTRYYDWVDYTSDIDSVRALLHQDNWNEYTSRTLFPQSIKISGYTSTTRQQNAPNVTDDNICTGFCGYFKKADVTYVICVMMEKTGVPTSSSQLRCIVPELIDYINTGKAQRN